MRSLIQLAGRVRRHRSAAVEGVNVLLLDSNLKHFERRFPHQAAFCKPGFEMDRYDTVSSTDASTSFSFKFHSLQKLLARECKAWGSESWPVDARPRIERTSGKLNPTLNWVDLEHARMRDAMLPRTADSATTTAVQRATYACWHHGQAQPHSVTLTGVLPQYQRFREDSQPRVDVVMLPDDDEEKLLLHRVDDGPRKGQSLYVCVHESMVHPIPDAPLHATHVQPWLQLDLMAALHALAQAQDLALMQCAQRYATISLPASTQGWRWHAVLGFNKEGG